MTDSGRQMRTGCSVCGGWHDDGERDGLGRASMNECRDNLARQLKEARAEIERLKRDDEKSV